MIYAEILHYFAAASHSSRRAGANTLVQHPASRKEILISQSLERRRGQKE
jgi:hypothetical protein